MAELPQYQVKVAKAVDHSKNKTKNGKVPHLLKYSPRPFNGAIDELGAGRGRQLTSVVIKTNVSMEKSEVGELPLSRNTAS